MARDLGGPGEGERRAAAAPGPIVATHPAKAGVLSTSAARHNGRSRICVARVPSVPTMRIKDAADYLGVSDDTVRRWVDRGLLASSTDEAGRKVVDGYEVAQVARDHATPRRTRRRRQLGPQPVRRPRHRHQDATT